MIFCSLPCHPAKKISSQPFSKEQRHPELNWKMMRCHRWHPLPHETKVGSYHGLHSDMRCVLMRLCWGEVCDGGDHLRCRVWLQLLLLLWRLRLRLSDVRWRCRLAQCRETRRRTRHLENLVWIWPLTWNTSVTSNQPKTCRLKEVKRRESFYQAFQLVNDWKLEHNSPKWQRDSNDDHRKGFSFKLRLWVSEAFDSLSVLLQEQNQLSNWCTPGKKISLSLCPTHSDPVNFNLISESTGSFVCSHHFVEKKRHTTNRTCQTCRQAPRYAVRTMQIHQTLRQFLPMFSALWEYFQPKQIPPLTICKRQHKMHSRNVFKHKEKNNRSLVSKFHRDRPQMLTWASFFLFFFTSLTCLFRGSTAP